ncbi:hypothetical protein BCY91_08430 [Pelobium manganitolerans]|uniref:Uncharacterized protein n=1 Tax=Pelobium manganitolerans TaxID=1842495 RepID=A0A419S499_9SPHI|nr:hypothetical protein BCY91_08430 [Pelobium manganitolerans]
MPFLSYPKSRQKFFLPGCLLTNTNPSWLSLNGTRPVIIDINWLSATTSAYASFSISRDSETLYTALDHLIKRTTAGKVMEKGPIFKIKPNALSMLFQPNL